MTKYLGLDIGTVRVGVSITDPSGSIAFPMSTFPFDVAIDEIAKVIEIEGIDQIVVGVPYKLSGKSGQSVELVDSFLSKLLIEKSEITVHRVDERFTTSLAEKQLRSMNRSASKSRDIIDQLAAVNILQTFLDSLR